MTRRIRLLIRLAAAASLACATAVLAAAQVTPAGSDPASKLATVLADLAEAVPQDRGRFVAARVPASTAALPKSVVDATRGRMLRMDDANQVQVYILLSAVTDDVIGQLTANGVAIEVTEVGQRRVQARVPASRLMAVAQLAAVDEIRLPNYGRRRAGAVTTEGDAILRADAVRGLSLDGTGVRVGVISDGIKGIFATVCATCAGVTGGPIDTGDLPPAAGVRSSTGILTTVTAGIVARSFTSTRDLEDTPPATCAFKGAGAEGTALLEIVHDIAPGAKLAFANGDTDLEFMQAVNFLAASNDVVIDDIGFFGMPYDGTSAVSSNTAAALNNDGFPIRAYFTSVGNDADEHYFGAYADSGVDGSTISGVTNGGRLHLFQQSADTTDVLGLGARPHNVVRLPQNGEVAIFLSWDDPFGGSGNNYDLYLVRESTGAVVASSRTVQGGRQDPLEFIDYVNNGAFDTFRIVVQNVNNAAQVRRLNLFSFQPECAAAGPVLLAPPRHERHNYNTAARSVSAQSDAGGSPVSVVAVGAICSASANAASQFPAIAPNESCNDTSHGTIEFFSSQGPTIDGRTKPDISAIDGVAITGAGTFPTPFFGTSAASPHMGAVAALVLQSAPCLLGRSTSTIAPAAARQTLRDLIVKNAVALGTTASNNVFGAGRADALAAVQKTQPSRTGATTLTFDGNTSLGAALTAAQLGFTDPNNCGLTTLNWTGGCGTGPNTTMTCPFGTTPVSVSASNNGVGFSASNDLSITVTDFSVDAAPSGVTLSAGQSATFTVTVSPQAGPFNSPIALSCNGASLPPGTACSFSPDMVTPGTSPVQSRMTLTTTKAASLSPGIGDDWRDRFRPIVALRGHMRPSVQRLIVILLALSLAALLSRSRRRARRFVAAVGAAAIAIAAAVQIAGAMASGIAIFPATVGFGSQIISTTTPSRIVSMTNVGADPLIVANISVSGDFAQVNSCGSTVAPGSTCSIVVTFTPTLAGSRTGTLSIVDNAAGAPHSVSLTGTGVAAPAAGSATPSGSYV
ncbi:MAG TPA: choice-of-anchor D domain-containing protein, partial [Vicinamibacterales bacterium]|nr:choice-of-anchor D domain-containing protein [Vicinamibacterales bacterium]